MEQISQYSYNPKYASFGELTSVQGRPQGQVEQIEQGKQYQYQTGLNKHVQQVYQPQGLYEGIERLEQYKAEGYDPYEAQEALTQAYEEMSEGKGINEAFAQKPINDDHEFTPVVTTEELAKNINMYW